MKAATSGPHSASIVRGTDINNDQVASARDFLTALDWPEAETTREITRERIAFLIAWYGALRYQAGALKLGSLETPGRLIEVPPITTKQNTDELEFEILELEDVTVRALNHN